MKTLEQFVKDRNSALYSLDEAKIRKFAKEYGVPVPVAEQAFWGGIYKAILGTKNPPEDVRVKAMQGLAVLGMSPGTNFERKD